MIKISAMKGDSELVLIDGMSILRSTVKELIQLGIDAVIDQSNGNIHNDISSNALDNSRIIPHDVMDNIDTLAEETIDSEILANS